ncbi:calcium-binding protein [Teredinibacter turnerae]|uniref:calcium-binding protein n=1 Tax=Teredinibacter turnerae TaxID=2426 RepID=UPI00038144E5|nr:calcium-binding protein [Teredinibacter turnerae]
MKILYFFGLILLFFSTHSFSKEKFFGIHEDIIWSTLRDGSNIPDASDVAFLIERIEELGVGSIRIPIRWQVISNGDECAMSTYSDPDYPVLAHRDNLQSLKAVINAIPDDIDILAYLDSPFHPSEENTTSESCLEIYKTNPELFGKRYKKYVELVLQEFGNRISHYEIWNEQNNSNFCLIPPYATAWSPWDYVNHILVNGYSAIKDYNSNYQVVYGGLVYNGVVGNTEELQNCTLNEFEVDRDFLNSTYTAMNSLSIAQATCSDARCYDIMAIHPYYLSDLFSGTSSLGQNNYYGPIEQTYDADGTSFVMQSRGDTTNAIWWTEIGEPLAREGTEPLSFHTDVLTQSYNLAQIIDNAQPYRTGQHNNLDRIFIFSLRDEEPDSANGSTVQNNFGLITAYTPTSNSNTVGNLARPAFYTYKDKIFQYSILPASIIDLFNTQSTEGDERVFSKTIWQSSCSESIGSCDDKFFGNPTADQGTLHFSTNPSPWNKTSLSVRKEISIPSSIPYLGNHVYFEAKVNSFHDSGIPGDVYAIITIGPKSSVSPNVIENGFLNGFHIFLRRISDTAISIGFKSSDISNNETDLFWETFQNPEFDFHSRLQKIEFTASKSGNWELNLSDSQGSLVFSRNSSQYGEHTALFTNKIGLRLMGMSGDQGVGGYVKFDDIKLTTKKLPTSSDIEQDLDQIIDDLVQQGSESDDILQGGANSDELYGNQGSDRNFGHQGDDLIHGGIGDDLLHGAQGDDFVYEDIGNDTLYGDLGKRQSNPTLHKVGIPR